MSTFGAHTGNTTGECEGEEEGEGEERVRNRGRSDRAGVNAVLPCFITFSPILFSSRLARRPSAAGRMNGQAEADRLPRPASARLEIATFLSSFRLLLTPGKSSRVMRELARSAGGFTRER